MKSIYNIDGGSMLKNVFNVMKKPSGVLKVVDQYLLTITNSDPDRLVNTNSPSQALSCPRSMYYKRMAFPSTPIDPRVLRICDNGTFMHDRWKSYMRKAKILVIDEIPMFDSEYVILGHADGLLNIAGKLSILELKSINTDQFKRLDAPKREHVAQSLIYLYCANKHYNAISKFSSIALKKHQGKYKKMFDHLQSGRKYSREEKINHEVELLKQFDEQLLKFGRVSNVWIIYENKNDQTAKEFSVTLDKHSNLLKEGLDGFLEVNEAIELKVPPKRICQNKGQANYCSFKDVCFKV